MTTANDCGRQLPTAGQVYFVEIGRYIKIGFTTNVAQRLKAFLTSSDEVELLLTIPGDRELEKTLHRKFAECRAARELFQRQYRLLEFIRFANDDGIEAAFQYLERSNPETQRRQNIENRAKREAAARQSRAEKDAYFAALVTERKNRLGW